MGGGGPWAKLTGKSKYLCKEGDIYKAKNVGNGLIWKNGGKEWNQFKSFNLIQTIGTQRYF